MSLESAKPPLPFGLDAVVSSCAHRPAIRSGDRLLTYAELGSEARGKYSLYAAAGIGAAVTVGVLAEDPTEFLTDVLALLMLQAVGVLLPQDTTRWELERLSSHLALNHLLSTASLGEQSVRIGRTRQLTRWDGRRTPLGDGARLGFLTSGTTGYSKVALRTEAAMMAEATAVSRGLGYAPGQRLAPLVPLHHSFGFGDCALSGMLAGVEVCILPRMHPSAYLHAIERDAIDTVALVPPQLRLLAEASKSAGYARLSVLSAGAPLDARTRELAVERLGCAIGQVYGTSETGVIALAPAHFGGGTTVGTTLRHMEVRLDALPPEWESTARTDQDTGLVTVRSRALFDGYATPQGIDDQSVRTGWFATGDLARWAHGELQLLGRLSCAINVAGVKVSAEEVEAALLAFPGVHSALVTGVGDSLAHQRIKAHVTPHDVDLHALRLFCEQHLSAPKRPHYYEAVAQLATTASGKVLRRPAALSEIASVLARPYPEE